jgi:molybdopterin/thiamine biosynthesis adenylyltransferase
MHKEFAITIPEQVNDVLTRHLIREDEQEDLCFALWVPSVGVSRYSVLVTELVLPNDGDRDVHGNVSFNPKFFKRACSLAMEKNVGLAFLHSHPFPGWQGMSSDDIKAEAGMAPTVHSLTNLPLVGMTVGDDGTWSGRIWNHQGAGKFAQLGAGIVKSVGKRFRASFDDKLIVKPKYREHFKRTRTVYGKESHETITRLRIGIVGLGSVGSVVAEILARMGLQEFCLIDFDVIKKHNLDRQLGATERDLGLTKVDVAARLIKRSATSQRVQIRRVNASISSELGYRALMDCDLIFSCVDRPWPRYILNHVVFAHLIPVIDGGIKVRFDANERFESAEWQLQTVAPGRPCLRCLGVYEPSEVDLERMGKLDDPSYLEGLPKDHHLKNNENIIPFSFNLASMEVFQFITFVTGTVGINVGVQRYRFVHGHISNYEDRACEKGCGFVAITGTGDRLIRPV